MEFINQIIRVIDSRVETAASATFGRLAEVLMPGFEMLVALLITVYGINLIFRFTNFSFSQLLGLLMKIGLIYMFLFIWDNFQLIFDAAKALFDNVGNFVRNFVAEKETVDQKAAADQMFGTLAEIIDTVSEAQSSMTRALVAGLLFCVLGILSAVYILVVAYAKLMLGVLIGLAPFMALFMIFERTKSMFEAWLGAVFGYLVYPVAVGAIIGIISGLLTEITKDTTAMNSLVSMLGFITVAILGIKMLSDVPQIAANITGQFNLGSMSGVVSGAMLGPMGGAKSFAKRRMMSFASGFMTGRTPYMQAKATDKSYAGAGMGARDWVGDRGRQLQRKFGEIDLIRRSNRT